jgi:chaperonin cofactor prefoldin
MHDPIKQPKYWRDRAEATRANAKRYYDARQIRRMLRVAEEYDKIADRAEDWQRTGEALVKSTRDAAKAVD